MVKKIDKKTNLTAKDILASRNWRTSIHNEKELLNVITTKQLKTDVMDQMVKFFTETDAETILDFCIAYCIPRSTLTYWAANDSEFHSVLTNMKLVLANKSFKGALNRKMDKEVVFKVIHRLDPDYLEINEYHDARTKDHNDNVREITQGVIREILQEFNYDKKDDNE